MNGNHLSKQLTFEWLDAIADHDRQLRLVRAGSASVKLVASVYPRVTKALSAAYPEHNSTHIDALAREYCDPDRKVFAHEKLFDELEV